MFARIRFALCQFVRHTFVALALFFTVFLSFSEAFAAETRVTVSAHAAETTAALTQGVVWRVYAEAEKPGGAPRMVSDAQAAIHTFLLAPGEYLLHASYGLASATKKIRVSGASQFEKLVLDAGALVIRARSGDQVLPRGKVSIALYLPEQGYTEGTPLIENLKPNDVVRLPAGTYHVISTYGDANAIVRTDVRVNAGKVTDATFNHRGSTITLKLVSDAGGEALANTAWSILTPGGDVIRESIGAFPTIVLSEGTYLAIARHEGRVFSQDFKVETGMDKDVELLEK
jgi:hypothetical protein